MTTYAYVVTGEDPRVFADLTHGPYVTVERDGAELVGHDEDGQPIPLDSTVVAEPGDVLRCPLVLVHAFLRPADDETAAAVDEAVEAAVEAAEEPSGVANTATVTASASVTHVVGTGEPEPVDETPAATPRKGRAPRS